uniref:Uncharacterized protein n=2 Tax=Caenorhabditis japonica TaxID=281687 RepID=A0A8R1IKC5_CAEJA
MEERVKLIEREYAARIKVKEKEIEEEKKRMTKELEDRIQKMKANCAEMLEKNKQENENRQKIDLLFDVVSDWAEIRHLFFGLVQTAKLTHTKQKLSYKKEKTTGNDKQATPNESSRINATINKQLRMSAQGDRCLFKII